jgi:hypothetical protein
VPEGVFDGEEAGPAAVGHAVGQAAGHAVQFPVEVAEGVVGGAQALVVEVGGEPRLSGFRQVAARHVGVQRAAVGEELRELGLDPVGVFVDGDL